MGNQDEKEKSLDRTHSLESIEFSNDDWCDLGSSISPSLQAAAYHSVRQQIAMGKGAFTSYVRSRGEPDGHTNCSSEPKTIDVVESNFPLSSSATQTTGQNKLYNKQPTYIRNVVGNARKQPPALSVRRADSSSSGSSMTDWESGLSTVKRREQGSALPMHSLATEHALPGLGRGNVPSCSLSGFESQGSDTEFTQTKTFYNGKPSRMPPSKRVTWKSNEKKNQPITITGENRNNGIANGKLWLKMGNFTPAKQTTDVTNTTNKNPAANNSSSENHKEMSNSVPNIPEKPKTTHCALKSSHMSQMARELPISDVYHERNLGLGLAPPLSKLLFSNSLSLSRTDGNNSGNKSDCEGGALSMDDTVSTFDQVSLVEDSIPGRSNVDSFSSGFKSLISPSRRIQMGPVRERTLNFKRRDPADSSVISPVKLNLKGLDNHGGGSIVVGSNSSSSSKSSPISDRRDEGDGRSLTDSQYGSYSPSMAQNDLIQTATAVYFCSRGGASSSSGTSNKGRERPTISEGDEGSCESKGDVNGSNDVSSKTSSNTYGSEVSSTDSCGGKSSIVEIEGRIYPSLETEESQMCSVGSDHGSSNSFVNGGGVGNNSFHQKSSQC